MRAAWLMVLLLVYALTLFVSASLLFTVQPLVGKLIVPLLGGLPSVWNTCMVFFQAMLLLGYAYAHLSTHWLGQRRQAFLHLGLLLLPALVLPLGVAKSLVPGGETNPVFAVLMLLTVSVGLPFFLVSTTAPLLQSWFAHTSHPAARDPYFLYAASNVGSMLALLSYPFLIEPHLTLGNQQVSWTVGYGFLALLTAGCAMLLWRSPSPGLLTDSAKESVRPPAADLPKTDTITLGRALRWVALAFVPSSLLLGVTTYITTDIATIPLLWILPLALYLLTFILVFSRLPALVHTIMVLILPLALLMVAFLMLSHLRVWMSITILMHLSVLFVVAMVCHGELAHDRPAAGSLTKFYLLMSLGGVLGGMFNALLAPVLFDSLAEYPVGLVLAALLMPSLGKKPARRWSLDVLALDLLLPLGVALVALEFLSSFSASRRVISPERMEMISAQVSQMADRLSVWFGLKTFPLGTFLIFGIPLLVCYALGWRPLRFGLGLALILGIGHLRDQSDPTVIYRGRSFFGVMTVRYAEDDDMLNDLLEGDAEWEPTISDMFRCLFGSRSDVGAEGPQWGYTLLYHGRILHGYQDRLPQYRAVPVSYYLRLRADRPVVCRL